MVDRRDVSRTVGPSGEEVIYKRVVAVGVGVGVRVGVRVGVGAGRSARQSLPGSQRATEKCWRKSEEC